MFHINWGYIIFLDVNQGNIQIFANEFFVVSIESKFKKQNLNLEIYKYLFDSQVLVFFVPFWLRIIKI